MTFCRWLSAGLMSNEKRFIFKSFKMSTLISTYYKRGYLIMNRVCGSDRKPLGVSDSCLLQTKVATGGRVPREFTSFILFKIHPRMDQRAESSLRKSE